MADASPSAAAPSNGKPRMPPGMVEAANDPRCRLIRQGLEELGLPPEKAESMAPVILGLTSNLGALLVGLAPYLKAWTSNPGLGAMLSGMRLFSFGQQQDSS